MEWETKHKIAVVAVLTVVATALVLFNQGREDMVWWHWLIILVFVFAIVISMFF